MPKPLLICLLGGLLLVVGLLRETALAQSDQNGISQPEPGAVLAGRVIVQGTATDASYLRYELAFWQESNPDAGWIVFAEGDQPVINGTLAVWDTTVGHQINAPVFPDGRYQLRLRVVRTDYNYNEYYVTNLTIANSEATPTATPTVEGDDQPAADDGTGFGTPSATQPQAPTSTALFQPLTPLPSLTPFPTLTPQPTPASNNPGVPETTADIENGGSGGVLDQLAAIDSNRFAHAFWQGAVISGYLFALMFLYLALRAIARRLWRLFWARRTR